MDIVNNDDEPPTIDFNSGYVHTITIPWHLNCNHEMSAMISDILDDQDALIMKHIAAMLKAQRKAYNKRKKQRRATCGRRRK